MYQTTRAARLGRALALVVGLAGSLVVAPMSTTTAAAVTDQITLFAHTDTHTASNYWTPPVSQPANYVTPSDYSKGRSYIRVDVLAKPSAKKLQAQVCMWRHGAVNFEFETCSPATKLSFTAPGTYWLDMGIPQYWWKLNGVWDWTKQASVIRVMLKDAATGKLMNSSACGESCYTGTDLASHVPVQLSAEMIMVAKGAALSPPDHWLAGCPLAWNSECGLTTPQVTVTGTTNSFTATWPAVTNANRYQLRYKLSTKTTWINPATFTATSFTKTGLATGLYNVEVRARVGGAWRNWASRTVTVAPPATWGLPGHAYRTRVTVDPGPTERTDAPAVVGVNFTSLLGQLGGGAATFDPASIRVFEVDGSGATIDPDVAFQFDQAAAYDATTNASGELVVVLAGTTPASTPRRFDVYFDVAGSGHAPATVDPEVVTVTGVTDEGAPAVRFETAIGNWWYDMPGGGFSSLDDVDGNDWISYNATEGAGGTFRGIPNAVHPAGYFHPGKTTMTTTVTHQGPLRATLETTSPGGGYLTRWHVYPTFAEMTMVQASGSYWFLYEGTPGGVLQPASDNVIRSDGSVIPASGNFVGDLLGEEWAAFTDAATARSLFVAQINGDSVTDSYKPLNNLMTVFGFGRAAQATTLLTRTPEVFRVGMVDGTTVGPVSGSVRAATRTIATAVGAIESEPEG